MEQLRGEDGLHTQFLHATQRHRVALPLAPSGLGTCEPENRHGPCYRASAIAAIANEIAPVAYEPTRVCFKSRSYPTDPGVSGSPFG